MSVLFRWEVSLRDCRMCEIRGFRLLQFFGFVAMVTYGVDAYFKLRGVQNGELAQGERVISKQVSTVTSPAY